MNVTNDDVRHTNLPGKAENQRSKRTIVGGCTNGTF